MDEISQCESDEEL